MLEKAVPRHGYKIFDNGEEIGYVTSGTMSPTFKRGIGMAIIEKENINVANYVDIEIRQKLYKAVIVERPLYKYRGNKK
jgi:aminomethyltransferase